MAHPFYMYLYALFGKNFYCVKVYEGYLISGKKKKKKDKVIIFS